MHVSVSRPPWVFRSDSTQPRGNPKVIRENIMELKSKDLDTCKFCKKLFKKKKPWQKFCNSKHRDAYHNGLKILKQNYDEELSK